MAITIYTQPNDNMGAYSPVPLRFSSSNVNEENFKYVTSILWNRIDSSTATSVLVNNELYTKFTTSSNHSFNNGDLILLEDSTTGYGGYYTIISTPSSTEVVIDLTLGQAITSTIYLSNVVKYTLPADLDGEAKLNLSKVLKNYVSYDFSDDNDDFAASNTYFDYRLNLGEESVTEWDFYDNGFISGGSVGFSGTTEPPFEIGDLISVEVDTLEWSYDDNQFYSGNLAFVSSTNKHDFKVGQEIIVTNQITEPYYNGVTTVTEVPDEYTVVTNKKFTTSTPVEPGKMYGQAWPGYNQTSTVTDKYNSGSDWFLSTDDGWISTSNLPVTGKIKYADGRLTENASVTTITGKTVYNAIIDKRDYTQSYFDGYLVDGTGKTTSTILSKDTTKKYRIEQSTKSWLLCHFDYSGTKYMQLEMYDANGNQVTSIQYTLTSTDKSVYVPVGLSQLLSTSMAALTVYPNPYLSQSIIDQTSYYTIRFRNSGGSKATTAITFELNDDCSRYDIYHLCWKDSYGSWLSYPFIYKAKESTEFERNKYYQKEGEFNTTDDTFGYETDKGGEQIFINRSRDKIILNSGWIEDFENDLIKDLLSSTKVFLQEPDNTMYQVVIQNDNFEFKTKDNNDMYQYSITVTYNDNKNNL